MDLEEWRSIPGYEGLYEVSNLGKVRSLDRVVTVYRNGKHHTQTYKGRLLKISCRTKDTKFPYPSAFLCKNGHPKEYVVHRLVAMAFLPNPDNLPVVNHIDCDPTNNVVSNLEWCTQSYNIQWGVKCGTFMKGRTVTQRMLESVSTRVYCVELDKEYSSQAQAVSELGVSPDYIRSSIDRKGIKSQKYYNVQDKYTFILPEDKQQYFEYLSKANTIKCALFAYNRNVLDLKTSKIFRSKSEFIECYNIPDGTANSTFFAKFDGYIPKYDCYLIDIGYSTQCMLDDQQRSKLMHQMLCKFVFSCSNNLIRCDTLNTVYGSAAHAEKVLNLPSGCIRERMAEYDGWYYKQNLHFSKVLPEDLTESEMFIVAEYFKSTFKNKTGGKHKCTNNPSVH